MKEIKMKSEYLYRGKIINLRLDDVKLINEKLAKREVVEHPGAVGILIVKDDLVWLVKQFRYPYLEELLEIVAGKLEDGELPYDTALRELKEEAGIITDYLIPLGSIYPSPGYNNEIIHLFYTNEFLVSDNCPDDDEFLEIKKIPIGKVEAMIDAGIIKDAKTIISILKYQRMIGYDK